MMEAMKKPVDKSNKTMQPHMMEMESVIQINGEHPSIAVLGCLARQLAMLSSQALRAGGDNQLKIMGLYRNERKEFGRKRGGVGA